MAYVRKRLGKKDDSDGNVENRSDYESEDEPLSRANIDLSSVISTGSDKTAEVLDAKLASLSPRWRNWTIRMIFTVLLLLLFIALIYIGPLALMLLVLAIQAKCFSEIINIGYAVYKLHGLPWFRSMSWYFLVASNYYFYGESLVEHLGMVEKRAECLQVLVKYHLFISFCLYIGGFVWFVLSLVKRYYLKQFGLFAWTHIALLVVAMQSYLIIRNLIHGIIWFIVPASMVICNDIMAYIFGFFFGRTPLIKLSPKKTWEGFIGGGLSTVVLSLLISYVLCQYPYFICPVEYSEKLGRLALQCEPSPLFRPQEYPLPDLVAPLVRLVTGKDTVAIIPFLLHSLSMSVFSSVIGPFGGFFASGFKRAFKIKDFGDVIPGHGGIMDRFDCQYLMGTFVNVYFNSFILNKESPEKLLAQISVLNPELQLEIFSALRDALQARGLL